MCARVCMSSNFQRNGNFFDTYCSSWLGNICIYSSSGLCIYMYTCCLIFSFEDVVDLPDPVLQDWSNDTADTYDTGNVMQQRVHVFWGMYNFQ